MSNHPLQLHPNWLFYVQGSWMPYGYGPRICGGMNVAHLTLRLVIIAIARNYDIIIPKETTPESMEQRFAFVRASHYIRSSADAKWNVCR